MQPSVMNLIVVIALLSSSKDIVDYLKLLIIWHEIMSFFIFYDVFHKNKCLLCNYELLPLY